MSSEERIFCPEQISANEQVRKFNENVLALAKELDGNVKKMRIEMGSNNGKGGYKLKCTPMRWERVIRQEEENGKKNKKRKGEMVEVSEKVELAPITRELHGSVPSKLVDSNLILQISSNRIFSETAPSAVLTDVALKEKSANGLSKNGSEKVLDLWVSARDGVQEKGSFQTYRAGFNEQEEWAEELAQVNELLDKAIEDLREEGGGGEA